MSEPVYIIILNWNGTNDTIECIKSIRENDYDNYKIVLVDNGSEKENLEELKNWCKEVFSLTVIYNREQAETGGIEVKELELESEKSRNKIVIIENNENLGFAAGNNVALKYTLKMPTNFAFLLNNDTIIEKKSISELVHFFKKNTDYVAVTPQIRYFDPNDRIWNCGGSLTWYGTRKYYYAMDNISKVPKYGYQQIEYITGCALFFKFRETGLLTEKFFFAEEDFELSLRLKKGKKKIACVFDSIIYHKVGRSQQKISNVFGDMYIHYLNRFIDLKQNSSKPLFIIQIFIHVANGFPKLILKHKFSLLKTIKLFYKIILDAYRNDMVTKEMFLKAYK